MTSSPGPISIASSASTSASVPFATPIVAGTPRYAAASSSNARTFGPRMKTPESSTSAIRLFISSSRGAYCAHTSTSGVCGTASQFTRPPTPDQKQDPARHEQTENGVIDVVEVLVEGLPVAPEGPADAREHEAPDGRADEGEDCVAAERHAKDTGRDG